MSKVVLFTFAGRKPYLEIQRGYVGELLDQHPTLEYHLWDFSRNAEDHAYLAELAATSPRIKLFDRFYEGANPVSTCVKQVGVVCGCVRCRVGKWSEPYKYYAGVKRHWQDLFVKVDDDIVFLETERFPLLLEAIRSRPGAIVSAKVVNNGLCTLTEQPLADTVLRAGLVRDERSAADWWSLCTQVEALRLSHRYFLTDPDALLRQEPATHQLPRTRFSINTIGLDWETMKAIAAKLGRVPGMDDEHVISANFDIHVLQGFLTAHLHYSDQRASLGGPEEETLLDGYRQLRDRYLHDRAALAGSGLQSRD